MRRLLDHFISDGTEEHELHNGLRNDDHGYLLLLAQRCVSDKKAKSAAIDHGSCMLYLVSSVYRLPARYCASPG